MSQPQNWSAGVHLWPASDVVAGVRWRELAVSAGGVVTGIATSCDCAERTTRAAGRER
jgi:hypothetical protein